MMEGQTVKWLGVNGMMQGVIVCKHKQGYGNWLVHLGEGRYVVVNENSFRR